MTHRDEVRAARGELYRRGVKLGLDMNAERSKIGSNQRTLSYDTLKLINDQTPRTTREQLTTDNPPTGVFDGVNTTFTLTSAVSGENIVVIFGDMSVPQATPLVKSAQNPPPSGAFYFNTITPTTIVVGDPPALEDALIAVYKTDL